jgi:hypothetical protein
MTTKGPVTGAIVVDSLLAALADIDADSVVVIQTGSGELHRIDEVVLMGIRELHRVDEEIVNLPATYVVIVAGPPIPRTLEGKTT